MNEHDFLASEELGIGAGDQMFMARFDSNLAMERRPLALEPRRSAFGWLKIVGIAVLFAFVALVVWPSGAHLIFSARSAAMAEIGALGLSPTMLFVLGGGILGVVAVWGPKLEFDANW